MFFENVKMALSSFLTNKLRTLLSLLGIVIGVSSVIIITTLGSSATADIKEEIAGAGLNMITVYGGWGSDEDAKQFTVDLAKELEENIQGVLSSTPVRTTGAMVYTRFVQENTRVNAAFYAFSEQFDYHPVSGRWISAEDMTQRRRVVVLGNEMGKRLFPYGGGVGSTIRILLSDGSSMAFEVIGVMEEKDSGSMDLNRNIYIPFDTFDAQIEPIDRIESINIQTSDPAQAVLVAQRIEGYLAQKMTSPRAFYVSSPSSVADMFKEVTNTLNLVLGGIAAISLLVGGIGIMNIMLVSVTERTREIGIRKALGATRRAILGQFLIESTALTMIGGLLGAILGAAIGKLVTSILEWTYSPDPRAFVISLSFAVVVGVFFGIYPASRAARLDPIGALSYE